MRTWVGGGPLTGATDDEMPWAGRHSTTRSEVVWRRCGRRRAGRGGPGVGGWPGCCLNCVCVLVPHAAPVQMVWLTHGRRGGRGAQGPCDKVAHADLDLPNEQTKIFESITLRGFLVVSLLEQGPGTHAGSWVDLTRLRFSEVLQESSCVARSSSDGKEIERCTGAAVDSSAGARTGLQPARCAGAVAQAHGPSGG